MTYAKVKARTVARPGADARESLWKMLQWRRPARSKTELAFIAKYLAPLKGVKPDAYGNMIGRIGTTAVLWSSHTDTVHSKGGLQKIERLGPSAMLARSEKDSSCLGADCTVGVWLMREMYLAGVPGLYVWHRDEEVGGLGSDHIAKETPGLLDGIQCAIAFDRKGYNSIITYQAGGRCASDAFAKSLSGQLGKGWKADEGGTFTDTANYPRLVPECTNLSVGYEGAHSVNESTDLDFAMLLLAAMKRLDIGALAIERDPSAIESEDWSGYYDRNIYDNGAQELADVVADYPQEVADILEQYGYTAAALLAEIETAYNR